MYFIVTTQKIWKHSAIKFGVVCRLFRTMACRAFNYCSK